MLGIFAFGALRTKMPVAIEQNETAFFIALRHLP